MAVTQRVGRIMAKWRGPHNPATTYETLDCVRGSDGSYLSLKDNNTAVLTDELAWAYIARDGAQGEALTWDDLTPNQQASLHAKEVELYRSGNYVYWRYTDQSNVPQQLLSLIEIGSGKVTYAERVALAPQEGLKVFQTDGAKGEYQYVNGAWYFIGNKFSKQITGGSYTLQESDIGYILEFTQDMAGVDVELHVPIDVFKDGHIIDIVQMGSSKVKIVPANLMVHHIDDIYINMRTFGRVAEAKIRFKGARECVITGGLE